MPLVSDYQNNVDQWFIITLFPLSGAPYSLNGVIVEKSLLLSWSPPLVSADYTDPIDFQYEVLLTKVNTSEVHQFTTNNTYLNINQFHKLTDHDICAEYWWNVSAMVEERKSVVTQSNVKVSIPSGTNIHE